MNTDKSPKRVAGINFLTSSNKLLKQLIDKLNQNKNRNLDRRPENEYKKEMYELGKVLVRSIADIYNIHRDPYLQDAFRIFIDTIFGSLKTLLFFIYSDRFKDTERTQKAVNWYWNKLKNEMINLVTDISIHYESAIEKEIRDTEFKHSENNKAETDVSSSSEKASESTRNKQADETGTGNSGQNEQEPLKDKITENIPALIDFQKQKAKRERKPKKGKLQQLSFLDEGSNAGSLLILKPTAKDLVDQGEEAQPKSTQGTSPAGNLTGENYTLNGTEYDGGVKSKFQKNIKAIGLLKSIEQSGRVISNEEKAVLSKYSGWGGIPQVFGNSGEEWNKEREELKNLLLQDEYEQARASTLNSFYTPAEVIDFIYKVIARLGYKGGNLLEPSCGCGFFFGLYPKEWFDKSSLNGVELDGITGRIARQLYPSVDIKIRGFEEVEYPENMFDLVVSNVPFGDYRVHDRKYNHLKLNIHDYFFAKALDVAKPGGIIAFITSKGTMDKVDGSFRKYMSERANLIGAVRLPNNAFKKCANTEVTADIIFLQKKSTDDQDNGTAWLNLSKNADGIDINEYYAGNPHMLMGKMAIWQRMFGRDNTTLMAEEGKSLGELLKESIAQFPKNIIKQDWSKNTLGSRFSNMDELPAYQYPDVKEYGHVIINGITYQKDGSLLKKVTYTGKRAERLKGMIGIKDTLRALINLQTNNMPDGQIHVAQAELNKLYDKFIGTYGYLTDKANKDIFREDPEAQLLFSIENVVAGNIVKADIFSKRTIYPHKRITKTNDVNEALTISLNETACIDFTLISVLTGKNEDECIKELQGRIFLNPQTQRWETAEEYLSGNVVKKMDIAQIYLDNDPNGANANYFRQNIEALKTVLPEPVKPEEIEVRLGSAWVDEQDIRDFICHLLKIESGEKNKVHVKYVKNVSTWEVSSEVYRGDVSVANTKTWGTNRVSAIRLTELALNLRQPAVYDKMPDGKQELNKPETIAARAKQDSIKEEFKNWIFVDAERRRRLTQKYNDKFNNTRLRSYNGDYLTLPGMNQNIKLDKHQKDAVARIVNGGNALLAHVVGSGKTYTCTSAGIELKRTNLVRKNLYVVPNNLTEQWGRSFMQQYPNAKVLVATKADFEKENRRRFISRIAVEEWDAVIIGHSMLKKIPVSRDLLQKTIQVQIEEIRDAVAELNKSKSSRSDNRLVKQLEKTQKNLEEAMLGLYDTERDNTLKFEELGIDQIFIDEADEFKNLGIITKMTNIAGISTTRSQKAFDLYVKIQHILEKRNGRGVVFATGTPLSNSIVEMYNLQKYLQPERLKEAGLGHFDSWASTFGETISAMEIAPDGSGYKVKQRFSKFFNLPEMLTMFREFADIQTSEMLNLPVPKLKGGKPVVISTDPTEELKDYIVDLVKRSDDIRSGRVNPMVDNMLCVTNDGRKAALDMRLVDSSVLDVLELKVNVAVENIHRIWDETKQNRLTQLVFCDISTPGDGTRFDVYNELKHKLILKGTPSDEIAFIHDANTDDRKIKLYDKVNAGIVRILIGSTNMMGAGTNVQHKLIALHHIDCPWRPRDIEQREGRILRRGNLNPEVEIYRYVTKESFDAYMWQTVENKARFINQVMNGKTTVRAAEDIDAASLSYAEVKAIASGNPLIMEKMDVDVKLQKLHVLKSMYMANRYSMQDEMQRLPARIQEMTQQIVALQKDTLIRKEIKGEENFIIEIQRKEYKDYKEAAKLLNVLFEKLKQDAAFAGQRCEVEVGSYAGFKLFVSYKKKFFTDDLYEVILKGHETYAVEMTPIPAILVNRLEKEISGIEVYIEKNTQQIAKCKKKEQDLKDELSKPFDHETELIKLTCRQRELNAILDKSKTTEVVDAEEKIV